MKLWRLSETNGELKFKNDNLVLENGVRWMEKNNGGKNLRDSKTDFQIINFQSLCWKFN